MSRYLLEAIAACGLCPRLPSELQKILGRKLREGVHLLYPDISAPDIENVVMEFRKAWVRDGEREPDLFPETVEALTGLRDEGYVLAVASNKSWGGLDRSLSFYPDVRALFSFERSTEQFPPKPDPAMLKDIMSVSKCSCSETLMIGDSEVDLVASNAAGIRFLPICRESHEFRENDFDNGSSILHDLRDSLAVIKKLERT